MNPIQKKFVFVVCLVYLTVTNLPNYPISIAIKIPIPIIPKIVHQKPCARPSLRFALSLSFNNPFSVCCAIVISHYLLLLFYLYFLLSSVLCDPFRLV